MTDNVHQFRTSLLAPRPKPTAPVPQPDVSINDFHAYMPTHSYIFIPTREMWPATSVNSRLAPVDVGMEKPMQPSNWLDRNRAVEQMTWAPGKDMVIRNQLLADGGWIQRLGNHTFNLYRPPTIKPMQGDPSPWVRHVQYLFGEECSNHIICWLAHRVQKPGEKVNHALVLGGSQGVGKDTLLEPIKQAIGPWNFAEVSPIQMLGRFNGFLKSVILRVSEARDLGDTDRYAFYDHLKAYTAAPPDVLRVDEKHLREHAVLNVCGLIITTNHKTDGIYLPADDRRHYVAWSDRTRDDFLPGYWPALYAWFAGGGNEIVASYLATLDLAGWDAKAPPPKTQAFYEIVDASRAPEDAEMADALDRLGRPAAVTLALLSTKAEREFRDWLGDRRNRRKIPHRLDECGYIPVRNPDAASDGMWKVGGRRVAVYAKRELSLRDQIAAAARLSPPTPS